MQNYIFLLVLPLRKKVYIFDTNLARYKSYYICHAAKVRQRAESILIFKAKASQPAFLLLDIVLRYIILKENIRNNMKPLLLTPNLLFP